MEVKLRHGPEQWPVKIEEISQDTLKITLPQNDQGIAPGQFAVFYKDGYCIGSGVID
ncbi:hypothetical protein COB57_04450 [Candidatus Peregrinibacteria bacterium]|nr:MAG: hypothetical protein COB57_04450 [Candidatus Peregrinibacteria bacterium]